MMKKIGVALFSALMACAAQAAPAPTQAASSASASAMRAKFNGLGESLRNNPYKRPIYVESAESSAALKGDIYAVLDHPFSSVSKALTDVAPWCDIMILPVNTKDCRTSGNALTVRIGRKYDQPIKDAYPIEFAFRVLDTSPEYFAVQLNADEGPLSTKDYRVLAEASPGDEGKTLLHLHYSYGYGLAGRLAMQAYLATAGAGKVGFSSSGNGLIGGMRGVVERNTMRYYLAVDAYLVAAAGSPAQRIDKRIATWFDSTEQYARQLHEIERPEYLAMKRKEVQRQQTALDTTSEPRASGGRI